MSTVLATQLSFLITGIWWLLLTLPLMPLVYLPMRKLRRVFDRE